MDHFNCQRDASNDLGNFFPFQQVNRKEKMSCADRRLSHEELSKFNGSDPNLPVYVAIKGKVFDVSRSRDMYVPGKGYHVFAGRDASKVNHSKLFFEDKRSISHLPMRMRRLLA